MGIFKLGFSFSGFSVPIVWQICLAIDAIIYEVADQALRTFFRLAALSADVQAYSNEIGYILSRVMVLAGIYALFRIAIMLINYLIDPGKIEEATKTGTQIVKNVVISVVLLVSLPFIFKVLGRIQQQIISQDVIPKLVYGLDAFDDEKNGIEQRSTKFVNDVFLIFFTPDKANCSGSSGPSYCKDYNAVKNAENGTGITGLMPYVYSPYFTYTPFISGLMGMVLIYYFVVFSIDLGARIIKLMVLQVISPIPVIMYIDPSQKNKLTNFFKAYSVLYLQVFLRIITLYMAFVVLDLVVNSDAFNTAINGGMLLAGNFFVKIILYIGVFQATKELPKLIEDALGVKMGSAPGGNSFGKVLAGVAGGAFGFTAGAIAGGLGARGSGAKVAAGGAVAGALAGMLAGGAGVAGSNNAAEGVKAAVKSAKDSHALGGRIAGTGGLGNFVVGGVENFFGGKGRDSATLAQFDDDIKAQDKKLETHNNKIGDIQKDIERDQGIMSTRSKASELKSKLEGSFAGKHGDLNTWLSRDKQYNAARDLLAEATDPKDIAYLQGEMQKHYDRVQSSYNTSRDSYFEENFDIYNGVSSGTMDEGFKSALEEYNSYVTDHGMDDRVISSYRGVNDGIEHSTKILESDMSIIQRRIDMREDQANVEKTQVQEITKAKKEIENKKKAFEKDSKFVRRNKRDGAPKYKSRNNN